LKSQAAEKLSDNYIKGIIAKFEVRNFPPLPFKSVNIQTEKILNLLAAFNAVKLGFSP
jgi:hypothetical protein